MSDPKDWSAIVAANPQLSKLLQPRMCPYVPHAPTAKQVAALLIDVKELLYGGSAGGGKSEFLLMAALQYWDVPEYKALILRRTYSSLSKPGALMDMARNWLYGKPGVKWVDKEKTWYFKSGASLTFGHLEHTNDLNTYQGSNYGFCAFDEAGQFPEAHYRYLFSRLRRRSDSTIPIRMRVASNPGGVGHSWIYQRFMVEGKENGRVFIPARLSDNPHIDQAEYIKSLAELDATTRAQLLNGDWTVRGDGGFFKREWFLPILPTAPKGLRKVRWWDLASSVVSNRNSDPDWTVGALVGELNGEYYVLDVQKIRATPRTVEQFARRIAEQDGEGIAQWIPQDPGQAGVAQAYRWRSQVMQGLTCYTEPVQGKGNKVDRARPVSSAAEQGLIHLVAGDWNTGDLLDSLEGFPTPGVHDDDIDALSGAFSKLRRSPIQVRVFGAGVTPGSVPW